MSDEYPVIQVCSEDAIHDEGLGTKNKFWIEIESERWLFKESRPGTGEDWSEKLAYEFAFLIGIHAARVELALLDGHRRGTVSLSFLDKKTGSGLIHGNEVLAGKVLGYDVNKKFGQTDHTIENILRAVEESFPERQQLEALKQLASYLVLDALIVNTDRHHENWGLIDARRHDGTRCVSVAPTFDHASSLGRDLLDENILRKFSTDEDIVRYIRRGKGAIYLASDGRKGENPLELVKTRCRVRPEIYAETLDSLRAKPLDKFLALIDRMSTDRMSAHSRQFVKAFVTHTYSELCNLRP